MLAPAVLAAVVECNVCLMLACDFTSFHARFFCAASTCDKLLRALIRSVSAYFQLPLCCVLLLRQSMKHSRPAGPM